MNYPYERGTAFEVYVESVLKKKLEDCRSGLRVQVFHQRKYRSPSTECRTDVSVEFSLKETSSPFCIWIVECKDTDAPVSSKEVYAFSDKIAGLGRSVVGFMAVTTGVTREARKIAKERGISVVNMRNGWDMLVDGAPKYVPPRAMQVADVMLLREVFENCGLSVRNLWRKSLMARMTSLRSLGCYSLIVIVLLSWKGCSLSLSRVKPVANSSLPVALSAPPKYQMDTRNSAKSDSPHAPLALPTYQKSAPDGPEPPRGNGEPVVKRIWIVPEFLMKLTSPRYNATNHFHFILRTPEDIAAWDGKRPLPACETDTSWFILSYHIANDSEYHLWYIDAPWEILNDQWKVIRTNALMTERLDGIVITGTAYCVKTRDTLGAILCRPGYANWDASVSQTETDAMTSRRDVSAETLVLRVPERYGYGNNDVFKRSLPDWVRGHSPSNYIEIFQRFNDRNPVLTKLQH